MRIGTDVSIQCCRDEGYMVMDYPVHELKRNPLTTDCRFTRSLPSYCRDGFVGEKIIEVDMLLNWNDLLEMFVDNKEGIVSMIGEDYYSDVEIPSPYDLLNLASDIDSYCGLI